jgi:glycosyltransferase involved in cell wall biosynthesis
MSKVPVSVIILTYNEEVNIRACLDSVKDLTDEIFIVDSFSTDRTLEIAREYTDKIYQNVWVDWAHQRNWALKNLPITHDWVFFVDADERLTKEFCNELHQKIASVLPEVAGMNVRFDFYFLGRCLHYAYESPPVLRLVRRERAIWEGKGAREYGAVKGKVITLQNRLIHDDQKGLLTWTIKQAHNAAREASRLWQEKNQETKTPSWQNPKGERPWRQLLREKVYNRFPQFVRPLLYFLYRYIVRLGFLDGKAGLIFCFLHGLWYPFLVDAKYYELCKVKKTHSNS